MFKSMTAYGRATLHSKKGQFVAEIQSVNRKFLEINITLPRELTRFEAELRKELSQCISRGQVTLKISVAYEETVPVKVSPNIPLAKQVKLAWEQLGQELGLKKEEIGVSLLAETEGILIFEESFEEEEAYQQPLKQVVESALAGFLKMKAREGLILQEDILGRVEKLDQWIKMIEQKAPQAPEKYRQKLIARLEEILPGKIENEERIVREVAVFAEKIDITEEITRFISHIDHFKTLAQSENSQVGKTLEFVLQELNREINTIGSKSSDIEISRYVIDIKSELERIREQIQNIE